MDVIVERVGALDVHKAQVTACVRVPGEQHARVPHLAEFKTTVPGLLALGDWLKAHGVTQVTMEATSVYWKPVWHVLEDDFELMLVNARHVKQVPGRKTDVSDAAWLCQLAEAGLLRASFVPPKPIRALRLVFPRFHRHLDACGGKPAGEEFKCHVHVPHIRRSFGVRRSSWCAARAARSPSSPRSWAARRSLCEAGLARPRSTAACARA